MGHTSTAETSGGRLRARPSATLYVDCGGPVGVDANSRSL